MSAPLPEHVRNRRGAIRSRTIRKCRCRIDYRFASCTKARRHVPQPPTTPSRRGGSHLSSGVMRPPASGKCPRTCPVSGTRTLAGRAARPI